eukprot:NODE_506_length_2982_cov_4.348862.p1 GENE.NODE_506_length_2982_cov_4.348862~~NODE_506_length_2982_cov_4.348862.p1  ORF type:complete len:655 (+),score=123.44 NODE_506_length_2982_cov_4.348862:38-1966(+)
MPHADGASALRSGQTERPPTTLPPLEIWMGRSGLESLGGSSGGGGAAAAGGCSHSPIVVSAVATATETAPATFTTSHSALPSPLPSAVDFAVAVRGAVVKALDGDDAPADEGLVAAPDEVAATTTLGGPSEATGVDAEAASAGSVHGGFSEAMDADEAPADEGLVAAPDEVAATTTHSGFSEAMCARVEAEAASAGLAGPVGENADTTAAGRAGAAKLGVAAGERRDVQSLGSDGAANASLLVAAAAAGQEEHVLEETVEAGRRCCAALCGLQRQPSAGSCVSTDCSTSLPAVSSPTSATTHAGTLADAMPQPPESPEAADGPEAESDGGDLTADGNILMPLTVRLAVATAGGPYCMPAAAVTHGMCDAVCEHGGLVDDEPHSTPAAFDTAECGSQLPAALEGEHGWQLPRVEDAAPPSTDNAAAEDGSAELPALADGKPPAAGAVERGHQAVDSEPPAVPADFDHADVEERGQQLPPAVDGRPLCVDSAGACERGQALDVVANGSLPSVPAPFESAAVDEHKHQVCRRQPLQRAPVSPPTASAAAATELPIREVMAGEASATAVVADSADDVTPAGRGASVANGVTPPKEARGPHGTGAAAHPNSKGLSMSSAASGAKVEPGGTQWLESLSSAFTNVFGTT